MPPHVGSSGLAEIFSHSLNDRDGPPPGLATIRGVGSGAGPSHRSRRGALVAAITVVRVGLSPVAAAWPENAPTWQHPTKQGFLFPSVASLACLSVVLWPMGERKLDWLSSWHLLARARHWWCLPFSNSVLDSGWLFAMFEPQFAELELDHIWEWHKGAHRAVQRTVLWAQLSLFILRLRRRFSSTAFVWFRAVGCSFRWPLASDALLRVAVSPDDPWWEKRGRPALHPGPHLT